MKIVFLIYFEISAIFCPTKLNKVNYQQSISIYIDY